MLGLAPIVAASPSLALPKPENVKSIVTGEAGPEMITTPLIFQDGKFLVNPANIASITVGTMRSPNGKTVIESLDGGDAVFRFYT